MQASLPFSLYINVAVASAPAAAPGPSFNQGLIVGPTPVIPSATRTREYFSTSAMQQDGFSTTDPEYLAAELYFAQAPAPYSVQIGRQDLTAIQTVAVGAAAGTGYAVNDIVNVVQGGASGGQVKITAVNSGVPTAIAPVAGSQGTGYTVANNLSTTGGTGTGLEVNVTAIGETPVQAVSACRLANPQWYCCMFVGTAADADHLAIAEFIEGASPAATYFISTASAAVLNNAANNLLAELQAASLGRTLSVYSTTQGGTFPNNAYAAAAPMGMAMGRNTGAPGSAFDLMFKPIAGVAYEPLTQTQIATICGTVDRSDKGLNGNVVVNVQNNSYVWLQNATMANGVFFDQVLFLDMLASIMQANGVALLTSVPKLPITDAGVTLMKNVMAQACETMKSIGFIAPAGVWQGLTIGTGSMAITTGQPLSSGYQIYSPPVSSLTLVQKAARVLPPMTVALIQAGSGHSLSVQVLAQA